MTTDAGGTAAVEKGADQRPPLDAIAEDLVAITPEPPAKKKPTPAQPKRQAVDMGDDDPAPEPLDLDDVDVGDDPDPDDEGGDDPFDFLDDLGQGDEPDPDLDDEGDGERYRVKVDGEEVEVSLAELKRRYSTEGAIEKRLQEAAEARNIARTESQQYVEQSRLIHERLSHVYQNYNQLLFAPRIERPDPSMLQHDPIGYQEQMAYWQQDQERLTNERAQMQQTLQYAEQLAAQDRKQRIAREAQALQTKFPKLRDKAAKAAFSKRIVEVAAAHGFSKEEVGIVEDHRLFTLAAEAAAYRDLKAQLAGKAVKPAKRRAMPTRGDNRQHGEVSRKANQRKRLNEKARKTGNVDDVAATLLL